MGINCAIDFHRRFPTSMAALLILLTSLLLPTISLADVTSDDTSAVTSDITFCISEVEPWGYTEANGEIKGVLFDTFQELSNITGIQHRYLSRPHSRVPDSLSSGECDYAAQFDTSTTVKGSTIVGPLQVVKFLALARSNVPPVDSVTDLAGFTVGYVRGVKYGPVFEDAKGIHRIPITNVGLGVKMLFGNRIDIMVGSDVAIDHEIERFGFNRAAFHSLILINSMTLSLYSSNKSVQRDLILRYKEATKKRHDGRQIQSEAHQEQANP